MNNLTKNPKRLLYLIIFQIFDTTITTILYSQWNKWQESFVVNVRFFDVNTSLFELWVFGAVRGIVVFGAVLGFIFSKNGKNALKKIGYIDRVVLVSGTFMWSYSIVKMLMYTDTEISKEILPWFWSLFAWSVVAPIAYYVNWSVLHRAKPCRKKTEVKSRTCNVNSTDEEQQKLIEDGQKESDSEDDSSDEDEDHKEKKKKEKKGDEKEEDTELQTSRDKAATVWKLLNLSRPDLPYIFTAFFFMVTCCAADTFTPFYTGEVIQGIAIDRDKHKFTIAIIYMSLFAAASAISSGMRAWFFKIAMSRLDIRIRNQLFTSLVQQEVGFFDTIKTGDISSRLQSDTAIMSSTLGFNCNVFVRSVLKASDISSRLQSDTAIMSSTLGFNCNIFIRSVLKSIGVVVFMVKLSWHLSMVTLIGLPIITGFSKIYGSFYEKLSEKVQTAFAKANEVAEETCSSMRTVRSFASEQIEKNRYSEKLGEVYKLNVKEAAAYAGYMWGNSFFSLSLTIATLYYGGYLVINNLLTGGNLVSFILYQSELGNCIQDIGYVYTGLMQAVGASHKVFSFIFRDPKISNTGKLQPNKLHGKLEFKNVHFAYPSRPETTVLKNVSFAVEPGEVVALVGPSGGGKSSCVNLLEHFYETKSGEVLLDGVPIQQYDHKFLHEKISLVGQEPVLFARKLSENIAYGLEDWTMETVEKAAQMANAHHFISEMKERYDTEAGEKGMQLSGGQKQRIAIARAIVRNPTVLLLDEATSALDSESEHVVQEAMYKNLKDRTVIIIAHRLSTVEKATRIIVINKGEVVEQGTHRELLQNGGMYCNLVKRQLLGFDNVTNDNNSNNSTKPEENSDKNQGQNVKSHPSSRNKPPDGLSCSPSHIINEAEGGRRRFPISNEDGLPIGSFHSVSPGNAGKITPFGSPGKFESVT